MPTEAIQPSLVNTQAVGAALLNQFARERFREVGVDEELVARAETSENLNPITNLANELPSHDMSMYGKELRKIADEFAKSPHRRSLKQKAEQVQLCDITRETFLLLLEELFRGGITRERIVALFFFCTDVALRAAAFAQELVIKLLGWSFSYIVNTVCRIVHENGGWQDILFRQLSYLLINCCAAVIIIASVLFVRNKLH